MSKCTTCVHKSCAKVTKRQGERSPTTREDVLSAFAMDFEPGKTGVLARYLSQYPEYSLQLVDLSRELSREIEEEKPLNAEELASVSRGINRLQSCGGALKPLAYQPGAITLREVDRASAALEVK